MSSARLMCGSSTTRSSWGVVMRAPMTARLPVNGPNLPALIAGITIVNDYSARDVQIPQMQFYKGKSYRSFGPVGPYLVLLEPEEFQLPEPADLRLSVNGETRQNDRPATSSTSCRRRWPNSPACMT